MIDIRFIDRETYIPPARLHVDGLPDDDLINHIRVSMIDIRSQESHEPEWIALWLTIDAEQEILRNPRVVEITGGLTRIGSPKFTLWGLPVKVGMTEELLASPAGYVIEYRRREPRGLLRH
jgi:hypothetical protein